MSMQQHVRVGARTYKVLETLRAETKRFEREESGEQTEETKSFTDICATSLQNLGTKSSEWDHAGLASNNM